jgi:transaldolase
MTPVRSAADPGGGSGGLLRRLHDEFGQSPWLDNVRRDDLVSGHLERLVAAGVRGVTSNPTIFQKSIEGSDAYDEQFRRLIRAGVDVESAYWSLVIDDIDGALDVLAPVHTASGGRDGHVSVEIDPRLAHDLDGTLHAVRDIARRIDRPNLLVKVPATVAGVDAVRTLVGEGHSLNVTLIFSLERYLRVMQAYVEGLETFSRRPGADLAAVTGVASFFISRVDTEVDRRLAEIGTPEALELRGHAAVAQARLAYQLFTTTFTGERWETLADAGAQVQRPLWASTSTKNPAYPDTLYVDELIGPASVNTLPDTTLDAFADHGTLTRSIDRDVDGARDTWQRLTDAGVDLRDVAEQLEREGVAAFESSYTELLAVLERRSSELS